MYGEPQGLPERSEDEAQQLFYDMTQSHLRQAQSPSLLSSSQMLELARRLPSLHLHEANPPSSVAQSMPYDDQLERLSARLKDVSRGYSDAGEAMLALGEAEAILLRQQRAAAALDAEEARIRAICNRSGSVSQLSHPVTPPAAATLEESGFPDQQSVAVSQYYAWYYWQYAMWYHWQQQQQHSASDNAAPLSPPTDRFDVSRESVKHPHELEQRPQAQNVHHVQTPHPFTTTATRSAGSESSAGRVYERKRADLEARKRLPKWQT